MLAKTKLNTVIKTIKKANKELDPAILLEKNKSAFMDFIKDNVEPNTDPMRIIVDLVNRNYFDLYVNDSLDEAIEIAEKTLKSFNASEEQIKEFLNSFFDFDDDETENSPEVEEAAESSDTSEIIEDTSEETEIEEDDEEEIDQESEEMEPVQSAPENNKQTKKESITINRGDIFGPIFFCVSMFAGILLFLKAAAIIKPVTADSLYKVYYFIFICFSLFVLFCCIWAQRDIFLLWKFYKKFQSSRGRKVDLTSNIKSINQICEAYKKSFLLNETYDKTRSNADLYFGSETYFNDMHKLPFQSFLKIIPGTFIGLGILGTFIGFAGGLTSINLTDSQTLVNGVQDLLSGLKSAFNTSIIGVIASIFLNFLLIHPLLNQLDSCSKQLCDYLDSKFFVSEVDAMSVTDENNKQIPFPQTMGIVLEKLEQVASNINHMGATVGDQVTQSVKATLDKTIEKIIKEEIKKLKEEMNSSISLLQECQKHLQNAPIHLKEAAEKMQAAAVNNDELFRRQNQESVEALTRTIEENLNSKFASYAKVVEETSEEMLNIKNTLALMPEDFSNIDKSLQTTTEKLSANQTTLENALSESTQAFDKTTEISESLTEAYDSQSKKIEEMISKFTDVLNEYKEVSKESKELLQGFKGMDEQIASIFERINENTKNYSEVIGNSLSNYLNSFSDATKDVSAKFADATDALREEVEKLNKSEKLKEEK